MTDHVRLDTEHELAGDDLLPPLVPPGTLVLTCELVEPLEFDGLRLHWYCPLPPARQRPGVATKFARAWVIAMGRRPQRGERPAYQDLVDRRLKVVVKSVTTSWERDHTGQPIQLPTSAHHSVVTAIVDRADWRQSPPHAR